MRLTVTNTLSLLVVTAGIACGQTQVDLRTQSKSVDFSGASSTKPFSSGPALPATCGIGQMYFVTTAFTGQNVYGCSATNVWSLQSGGPTSPTTVENAGTVVGTRGVLDLSAGQGIVWSISDTGTAIAAQTLVDTTLVQTRADDQSGANLLCSSNSTASPGVAYICAMNPTLTVYTPGMVIHWEPDVNAVGSAATTLNVDSLGAVTIENSDGVTNPTSSAILAGHLYHLWYDGHVFRLMISSASGSGSGSAPTIATGGYSFPFGFPVDGGSTSLTQTGVAKLSMFVPSIGMSVASLAYYVTGATGCSSGSPCELALGLYNSAGTLLEQKASTVTATGAFLVSFTTSVPLTAGSVYYFAWAADSVNVALQAAGGGSLLFSELANLNGVRAGIASNGVSGSGAGLTLPATSGGLIVQSGTYAAAPAIGFFM